jgi:TolB protein
LYDFKGEELKKLAEGTQIMGTSWSSDGAKLAYTVASENKSEAGLFVFDCKTEKTVQLAVDIQYISDYVKWSPSGKKMLASNFVKENNTNLITTYIIELK